MKWLAGLLSFWMLLNFPNDAFSVIGGGMIRHKIFCRNDDG